MKNSHLVVLALIALAFFLRAKRRRTGATKLPSKKVEKLPQPKPAPGWTAYREQLAQKESSGKYDARRAGSRYWGRYQLGPNARKVGGAAGVKWVKYKTDHALQDAAVKKWSARLLSEIKATPTLSAAIGKTLHGQKVTAALLVAMDHLTGRAALMKWARTGKTTKDGNGIENLSYAQPFAKFDLSDLERATT